MDNRGLGFSFAILSAIAWGTNGVFCAFLSKLGLNSVNIAMLAPMSNFTFFFFILLLNNRAGFRVSFRLFLFLVLDGLFASLVNVSFVNSVRYFPVGIVSTLVFCNVFVIMLMSKIFFKTKITSQKIFSAIAAVIGVSLVLNVFGGSFVINPNGLFWIIMTILAWSTMVTIEKYLLEKGVDGNAVLMYTGLIAIIILSFSSPPWALTNNIILAIKHNGSIVLLAILGYALIPQVLCYYFYITGLKYIDPSYIQVAYSLDPVTASILGFFLFGQTLNLSQIMGITLILVVVGYVQIKERQQGTQAL